MASPDKQPQPVLESDAVGELAQRRNSFGLARLEASPALSTRVSARAERQDSAGLSAWKIVTVGERATGKSCLRMAFTDGAKFDSTYVQSLPMEFSSRRIEIAGTSVKIVVFELMPWPTINARDWCRNVKGVMFVFDITNRSSFEALDKWFAAAADEKGTTRRMLVGCKSDLRDRRAVPESEALQWASSRGMPYIETSAVTMANVTTAFVTLAQE